MLNTVEDLLAASVKSDPSACAPKEAAPAPPAAKGKGKEKDKEPPPDTTGPAIKKALCEARAAEARRGPSPLEVVMLYDVAARQRRHLQDTKKSIETFQTLLGDLAKAEADLVACAEGKLDDQAALERVLSLAGGIVKQLDTLKTLAARKE